MWKGLTMSETKQYVYVIQEDYGDGPKLDSIYSTREKAKQGAKNKKINLKDDNFFISRILIDECCKSKD